MFRTTLLACSLLTLVACGVQPEPTGTATQPIQSTCTKTAGDTQARYPWEATYPLGPQHVFCQHMDTETSQTTWPAVSGTCTGNPNGGQIPGSGQVDVWVRNNIAPPNTEWRCTRITLPTLPSHFHLAWEPMQEWGWLTSPAANAQRRWISGIYAGPGTAATVAATNADPAGPTGCPVPQTTYCAATSVPWNGTATYITVDATMFPEGVDFHRY